MNENDFVVILLIIIIAMSFIIFVIFIGETGKINAKVTELMRMAGCVEFEYYYDYRCPINGTLSYQGYKLVK